MFNKRKQPPIRSLIAHGSHIAGDYRFNDGLRIDGDLVGDIRANEDQPSILVVSETAWSRVDFTQTTSSSMAMCMGRCMPTSCSNCSPRPVSRVMCTTARLKCTRAPPSLV